MKQSVCFQLKNSFLLKFKSSYVITETAVQQPPKQEAVHCAAFSVLSWLCVSQHRGEARTAETAFQRMPVDGFKLYSMSLPGSWCIVDVACLCCPVVSGDRPDMGSSPLLRGFFQGGKNWHV